MRQKKVKDCKKQSSSVAFSLFLWEQLQSCDDGAVTSTYNIL